MSDAVSQNLHLKSVLLTAVFLLASLGPMLAMPAPVETLDEPHDVRHNAPFSLTSGYGHDLAGTSVSVDGLDGAIVREESMFDYWHATELNNSSSEHHGTPDMKLARHDKEHYCWSTEEGPVRTAVHRPNGAWSSTCLLYTSPSPRD